MPTHKGVRLKYKSRNTPSRSIQAKTQATSGDGPSSSTAAISSRNMPATISLSQRPGDQNQLGGKKRYQNRLPSIFEKTPALAGTALNSRGNSMPPEVTQNEPQSFLPAVNAHKKVNGATYIV